MANTQKGKERHGLTADQLCLAANIKQIQRFWAHVREDHSNCWLFDKTTAYGYGRFHLNGRDMHAHRVAKLWHDNCAPQTGMQAMHICRNRNCVNPGHIEWGTCKQNMQQKVIDLTNKPWTHCGQRHPRAKLSDAQAIAIFERYQKGGVSMRALGQKFGVSASAVNNLLKGRAWVDVLSDGMPTRVRTNLDGRARGAAHPHSKLTKERARLAKVLMSEGVSRAEVARKFGVSRTTMIALAKGEVWKDA